MSLKSKISRKAYKVLGPERMIDLRYRLLGKKVDRNQWLEPDHVSRYDAMMSMTWEQTAADAPQYFARLSYTVDKARGRVLEFGAGVGTMTRFLAESEAVNEVVATDGFAEAVAGLQAHNLPKVSAYCTGVDLAGVPDGAFDTVVICEVLEHLYLDEEKALLRQILPRVTPQSRYVISLPIDWLDDPHHVRGFSKSKFLKHLNRYYGPVQDVDYSSGYSQVAWGYFRR